MLRMKNNYIIKKDKEKKKTNDFTKSDLIGYKMSESKKFLDFGKFF